jgi:hypothetical protein
MFLSKIPTLSHKTRQGWGIRMSFIAFGVPGAWPRLVGVKTGWLPGGQELEPQSARRKAAEIAKKISDASEERTAEGRVADSENLRIEAAGRPTLRSREAWGSRFCGGA